jgi:hypothetical protein
MVTHRCPMLPLHGQGDHASHVEANTNEQGQGDNGQGEGRSCHTATARAQHIQTRHTCTLPNSHLKKHAKGKAAAASNMWAQSSLNAPSLMYWVEPSESLKRPYTPSPNKMATTAKPTAHKRRTSSR